MGQQRHDLIAHINLAAVNYTSITPCCEKIKFRFS